MSSPELPLVSPASLPPGFDDPAIPRIAVEPVESCVVCGSREWNPFAEGYDYDLRTCRNRWHFVACAHCDHVRLHPRPRSDTLGLVCPAQATSDPRPSTLAEKATAWRDRHRFARILSQLPQAPGRYLDVGCGKGQYLELMSARGVAPHHIYGLELDLPMVEALRGRGYQVFRSGVRECQEIVPGSLDLITIFHGIAGVDRPDLVIRRLAEWLSPGGQLVLATPNLDSWDARLFRQRFWGGYQMPRHWHLFTQDTLAKLLTAEGFDQIAVQYQTGELNWLSSIAHSLRYGKRPHPNLAGLFDPRTAALPLFAAATGFDQLRLALGARTSAMLFTARKSGALPPSRPK